MDADLAFLRDLAEGTFTVECLDRTERRSAVELAQGHRDPELGLAASGYVSELRRLPIRKIVVAILARDCSIEGALEPRAGALAEDVGDGLFGGLVAGVDPQADAGELTGHDVFEVSPVGGDGLFGALSVSR